MMVAWVGMAAGGYLGGVLFDLSQSYTTSFLLAGMSGVLNLVVIAAYAATKNSSAMPIKLKGKSAGAHTM
jgi:hypothetical protein